MKAATSWPYIITVRREDKDSEFQFWNMANARKFFNEQVDVEGNIVFASHKGLPLTFPRVI